MANKILPGRFDFSGKNVLFLDCDTKVHLPVEFDDTQGIYVAYDALQTLPKDVFELVFKDIAVPLPAGNFVSCPSFEYYYNDNTEFFPIWNAGVYYLRNDLKASFYERYLRNFLDIHERHFNKEWRFYIEQLAFTAAALQLGTPVSIFPKGINFICTPRANQLKEWPADKIIIEHYAGDTSRPLAFNGTKIVEY